MAGSRVEKYGSIFKRLQGLLRSEALKDIDKPVWYDVYEAFPPKVPPVYERPVPQREVPKILYPEDIIRVKFYKTFGNPDVIDLTNQRVKTTCQRFVESYIELMKKNDIPEEQLVAAAAAAVREQGYKLRTFEEVQASTMQQSDTNIQPQKMDKKEELHRFTVAQIFGEKTVKDNEEEIQDFFIEDDDDTDKKSKKPQ